VRIFLSAGEASGDAVAAALVEELRKTGRDFIFQGVGGKLLEAAIGPLAASSSTWGAISIVQSVAVMRRAVSGGMKARRQMAKGAPGIFVPIDFGFFNIRQARWAKGHGWKVVYFMPPGSYKRQRQGRNLSEVVDKVVTPFPWSEEILRGQGIDASFFGHPIKQLIRMNPVPEQSKDPQRIAVLSGSRTTEMARHLPLVAQLVNAQSGDLTGMTIEFAIAPSFDIDEVKAKWETLAPGRQDVFSTGGVYGVLDRAQAAIVCSGTATLEAALMRCPHVVVYRITKAMEREAKLIGFKRPRFIALPNIVLEREVVRELVGLEIEPETVLRELTPLLHPGDARAAQLRAFAEIDQILGRDDAITKTAEMIAMMSA